MDIVETVRERLPQEIMLKLNCVSYSSHWYESAYYPFMVLVKTICDVLYEEKNKCCEYDECVDVVNEITGLDLFLYESDDNWDEDDERLYDLFSSNCDYD